MPKIDNTISFEALSLAVGQTLKVLLDPSAPDSAVKAVYIGALPNEAMIITFPDDTEIPAVKEGERVIIRTTTGDGVVLFSTTILFLTEIPTLMLYMDLPSKIQFKQIRETRRVEVNMPIMLSNRTTSENGIEGTILDLSISGARIESPEVFGELGNEVLIKANFKLGELSKYVTLKAKITKKIPNKKGNFSCIVTFSNNNDDELFILHGFIYFLMLDGRLQKLM